MATEQTTTEYFEPQHLIIFGDPKAGKSTLTAKLATEGYTLWWFSTDNGHRVINKLSTEVKQEKIKLFVLPDTPDFPVAQATLKKVLAGGEHKICEGHGQLNCSACTKDGGEFKSINAYKFGAKDILVIDTIKQLYESYSNVIRNKVPEAKRDEFKLGWDEYAILGNAMKRDLTYIQQAPFHVICITHSVETVMEDDKKKLVPEVGTMPFSRNVGGYFDHVVYCSMYNKAHKFGSRTTYSMSVLTGSRSDLAIEDDESGAASLKPFFDGVIGKAVQNGETPVAKKPEVAKPGAAIIAASTPAVAGETAIDRARRLLETQKKAMGGGK